MALTGLETDKSNKRSSLIQQHRSQPSKKINLFSRNERDSTRSPKHLGKNMQVGDNFVLVHPSEKYPIREVIFGNADYLYNTRLNNQSNSSRPTSGVPFSKQLNRNAPVLSRSRKYSEDGSRRVRPRTTLNSVQNFKMNARIMSAGVYSDEPGINQLQNQ